jgi:hypothetical protein
VVKNELDYQSHRNLRRSFPRHLIIGFSITMLAVALVVVVPFAWWNHGFNKRMNLAEAHAPIVRRVLEADGRFSDIWVEAFTGSDGCLLVEAAAKPGSVEALKRLVESTSPPVLVRYNIHERKPPQTQCAP